MAIHGCHLYLGLSTIYVLYLASSNKKTILGGPMQKKQAFWLGAYFLLKVIETLFFNYYCRAVALEINSIIWSQTTICKRHQLLIALSRDIKLLMMLNQFSHLSSSKYVQSTMCSHERKTNPGCPGFPGYLYSA